MSRLVAVLILATLPFLTGYVRRLPKRWHALALSAAGGISVSYVFVDLLPVLATNQRDVIDRHGVMPFLEHHLYVVALIGLVTVYAIERFAMNDTPIGTTFSIASTTVALGLVTYSIATKNDADIQPIALFTIALGLHYFVAEESLSERLGPLYHRIGRYVISAGALLGGALGVAMNVNQTAVAVVLAFIAGGVILRTIRHELPGGGTEGGSFPAFTAGAAAYTIILMALPS